MSCVVATTPRHKGKPRSPAPSSAIHAGAHPIAKAQCLFFRPEARLRDRKATCPPKRGASNCTLGFSRKAG
jgi:hypothetical protein